MTLESLFSNFQTCRPPVTIPPSRPKQHFLPDSYVMVPAVALTTSAIDVPMHLNSNTEPLQTYLCEAQSEEKCFSENALTLAKNSIVKIVWCGAAYHGSSYRRSSSCVCATTTFLWEGCYPAMVKHDTKTSNWVPQPRTNSGYYLWSATVCPGKAYTMEVASYSRRLNACCHAWWFAYRDGPLEYNRGCEAGRQLINQ